MATSSLGAATAKSRLGTPFEQYTATCPKPGSWSDEMAAGVAGIRGLLRDAPIPVIREALDNRHATRDNVEISPRYEVPRLDASKVPDALWKGSVGRREPVGALKAEMLSPKGGPDKLKPLVVMFHGGGYIVGSAGGSRPYALQIVGDHGLSVLSFDYGLAPENPFPIAPLDAISAHLHAISLGWPASRIVWTGDSAGAGLCFGAAMVIRDFGKEMGWPMPAALCPITPYVDMQLTSPTMLLGSLAPESPFSLCMLTHMACRQSTTSYAGTEYPFNADISKSPYFTPVIDRKPGLCPTWVFTGGYDTLLAEDSALVMRRNAAGDVSILEIWSEMPHDPHLAAGPEACLKTSISNMVRFIEQVTTDPKSVKRGYFVGDSYTGKMTELTADQLQEKIKGYVDECQKLGLFDEIVGGQEAAANYSKIL